MDTPHHQDDVHWLDDSRQLELEDGPTMPFKSQAQRRKFAQLLVEGKISNETFEEWNRETGAERLPERVGAKKRAAKRSSAKRVRSKRPARPRKRA